MKFAEPDDIDLTVIPKHLTDEEAAEISAFIRQYKAQRKQASLKIRVSLVNNKELDLLLALFQQMNVKWMPLFSKSFHFSK